MNFLLDTSAVSEWMKPRIDPAAARWLAEADEDRTFLSVVTLAELRSGVDQMPEGQRRDRLDSWLRHELPLRFEDRIIPVDVAITGCCGQITARRRKLGRPIGAMDAFLAATAVVRALTLVTRNVSDFEALDIPIVNPWTSA